MDSQIQCSEDLYMLYKNTEPLRFRILEQMIKNEEVIIVPNSNIGRTKNANNN